MKHMIIQTQKTVYKVNVDDIYYIQTHPTKAHTVQIVTEEASFNMLQNLSNLENQYGETLMRCHRNCLVNLDKLIFLFIAYVFLIIFILNLFRN